MPFTPETDQRYRNQDQFFNPLGSLGRQGWQRQQQPYGTARNQMMDQMFGGGRRNQRMGRGQVNTSRFGAGQMPQPW